MFYIRADANPQLGSGHVMRCLSIAAAIRKKGQDVTFITADRQSENLIQSKGFPMICLDCRWDDLDYEIDKIKELIHKEKIKFMLIDSYYVTEGYLKELNQITEVSYLDDLNRFVYPVRTLINYSISAKEENYLMYSKMVNRILGCSYIPLREEFICVKRESNRVVKSVLITTGGADPYNFAGQLLTYLRRDRYFDGIVLNIVIGPLNQNGVILEEMAGRFENVILNSNVAKMSELMLKSDLAISAGGSTLYELCACGTPTISFSYADNQKEGTIEFDRRGLIFYAGDLREGMESCMSKISIKLKELCEDVALRKELTVKMQELVDGFGADRIAAQLLTS